MATADEKEHYAIKSSEDAREAVGGDHKASVDEAANLYGDVEKAQQYGYVNRGYVCSNLPTPSIGTCVD